MSLFGKKTPGRTVLLVDVEQGSVATALARLAPGEKPRLFGEVREHIPFTATHDSGTLARELLRAAERALAHASLVAARVRQNDTAAPLGTVASAAFFLSAPWGVPDLAADAPRFSGALREELINAARAYFGLPGRGQLPVSFYTGADAAAFAGRVHTPEPALLVAMRGELSELLALSGRQVEGYATAPAGVRTLLRTLRTHGGLSAAEAASLLALAHETPGHEALAAARAHMVHEMKRAAPQLIKRAGAHVLVLAEGGHAAFLARSLAEDDDFAGLFPQGGAVEPLAARHFSPHIAAHAARPDIFLLTETLFVDALSNRV